MAVLYVTSVTGASGKTAICAGVGKNLLDKGKKVGFFKPVSGGKVTDGDCAFMKRVLELAEPAESLCAAVGGDVEGSVRKAFEKVSTGKDVVIVEGTGGSLDSKIAAALGAKVIVVVDYADVATPVKSYQAYGKSLLGVVLNKVPVNKAGQARNDMSARLAEAGIKLLGVLPEDRLLYALTVGELAENLHGKLLNSAEKSGELVENVMAGAMTLSPGPLYFGRKERKAAVIRSDRPDMQLAALETPTKCLIVAGDAEIFSAVMHGAQTREVPVISVKGDIAATIAGIDEALSKSRFGQEKKLKRLSELMAKNLDLQAVAQGLA